MCMGAGPQGQGTPFISSFQPLSQVMGSEYGVQAASCSELHTLRRRWCHGGTRNLELEGWGSIQSWLLVPAKLRLGQSVSPLSESLRVKGHLTTLSPPGCGEVREDMGDGAS